MKVLVIVGPTASGKSDLAVRVAKKFKGEVISADSRQVYKGLDIGTGKITKREMQGVSHHMLDVAEPKKQFSVAQYKKMAEEEWRFIESRNRLPIIVGGTGFYIDALTGRAGFPNVPANPKLRTKLMKLPNTKLFAMVEKKDPERAKSIDPNNKVRLVRALEIITKLGKVPPLRQGSSGQAHKFIYIGLNPKDLEKRIYKRLIKRIPGIIKETKTLSSKRAYDLGLEYRYASLYLKNKLDKKEMIEQLNIAIRQYAKRQMTWFKRNHEITWFGSSSAAYAAILKLWGAKRQSRSRR